MGTYQAEAWGIGPVARSEKRNMCQINVMGVGKGRPKVASEKKASPWFLLLIDGCQSETPKCVLVSPSPWSTPGEYKIE